MKTTELSDSDVDRLARRIAERLLSSLIFQDGEELYTLTEISHFLKVSSAWVKRNIEAEGLPHFKVGANYRFRKAEVMVWMKGRKV